MELRQFVDHVPDPALGLAGDTVRVLNTEARSIFGVHADDTRIRVSDLFGEDADLAAQYSDTLRHYPDVGGVIEGDRRHFDRDHTAIESLLEGRTFSTTDPDVGVFVDGDLRYFHLQRSDLADRSGPTDSLVVFREVTDLKDNERDLDFLRQVLTRILRHNLKNDLTVVRGYASSIASETDDDVAEMASKIDDICGDLTDTAEKARAIQNAVQADRTVTFDLSGVVTDAVESVDESHGGEFEVDVPPEDIEVNPEFPDAIEDAIENAIVYNDGPSPVVEVAADRDGPWVFLTITDNGPGIPENELDALIHRGETDLVHGSGAGLWLTHTVARESGGDISYDVDDSGTTVRMRLPAAD